MKLSKIIALALAFMALPAQAQIYSSSPAAQRMGGNGKDGVKSINTSSISGPIQTNATTYILNTSQTLTCDTASPVVICATRTITINGTITMTAAGGAGGIGGSTNDYAGNNGSGPGAGATCDDLGRSGSGGGGAGCGGYGGRGGNGGSGAGRGGAGGSAYLSWRHGGSGGGGGMGSTGGSGGAGGTGGSCLILSCAGSLVVASGATITASGTAGAAGTTQGGGGGGGSGGIVWCVSQSGVTLTGSTITVAGGNGGNGAGSFSGGGGGAAGGRRFMWSPSNTGSAATATAGSAGTGGGSGQAGEAGQAGASTSITGYPSEMLLSWMDLPNADGVVPHIAGIKQGEGIAWMNERVQSSVNRGEHNIEISTREMARQVAQGPNGFDLNLYAKAISCDADAMGVCDLESTQAFKEAA